MTEPALYLPPPVRCESLAAMAARDGGRRVVRAETPAEALALPGRATAELRACLARQQPGGISVEALASLPGGRVFGHGAVLSADGTSVARDVSLDFGRPADTHWLLGERRLRPPTVLPGITAVIASALGEGYCHWLLDELPRLLVLGRQEQETSLLAHAGAAYARAALAHFGWSGPVIEPKRRSYFQCEELLVPTLPGWTGHATPRQLALIREFAVGLPGVSGGAGEPERIYIDRTGARRRQVANEPAVIGALAAKGFVAVRLEDLPWAEQIDRFRRAKVIVAPHGAGLANLVFCEPGTRVIELFDRSYVNGCFWQLAALRGLDYRPLVAAGDEALGAEPGHNRCDIVVDLAGLVVALR